MATEAGTRAEPRVPCLEQRMPVYCEAEGGGACNVTGYLSTIEKSGFNFNFVWGDLPEFDLTKDRFDSIPTSLLTSLLTSLRPRLGRTCLTSPGTGLTSL